VNVPTRVELPVVESPSADADITSVSNSCTMSLVLSSHDWKVCVVVTWPIIGFDIS